MKSRRYSKTGWKKTFASLLGMASGPSLLAGSMPFMLPGPGQPPVPPKPALVSAPGMGAATNSFASLHSTNALEKLLDGDIPGALAQGRLNVNARLRYEQDEEEGVKAITKGAYAPTFRTRLGYTTAPVYGLDAMIEGVNVTALGPEHNYNAAGSNGQGARPVVADPALTRVDQAWVGYNLTNVLSAKVGQQDINLDNQRFIGDVNWRQNMQTFNAASMSVTPFKDFAIYYSYLWYVNRVFGNVSGLPAANTDFKSHSHLINLDYSGWKYGRFVGYAYLLNLKDNVDDLSSCATYGGYFAGQAPLSRNLWVDYRAEYAWQTQYGNSPLRYDASYFNLESGLRLDPVALGAGFEDLGGAVNGGAAGGYTSFRTPLATLHAFNGWADVFLTTPSQGLHDLYAYCQVNLPLNLPVYFTFHKYDADYGGGNYGQEYDVMVSRKFLKHWSALLAYAYYQGGDAPVPSLPSPNVDVQKFWAQLEFNY